jgi:hypothetical protein
MSVTLKAALILIVLASAFTLGRYSVEFSGRGTAWAALVLAVIGMAMAVYALLFG